MRLRSLPLLAILLMSVGCALAQRVDKEVPAIFLEDVDRSQRLETLPFEHGWKIADPPAKEYRRLFIKPIRTDLLPEDTWRSSQSVAVTSKESFTEKAAEIADYFGAQLRKRFEEYPTQRFLLAEAPGAETLTLEIAITELQLSLPMTRAVALAIPVPGVGAAVSSMSDPHVSFAARITDAETNQLLATIADRKFSPTRILDLNKLTASSSAREICSLWATSLAQAFQSGGLIKVHEERFSILPW